MGFNTLFRICSPRYVICRLRSLLIWISPPNRLTTTFVNAWKVLCCRLHEPAWLTTFASSLSGQKSSVDKYYFWRQRTSYCQQKTARVWQLFSAGLLPVTWVSTIQDWQQDFFWRMEQHQLYEMCVFKSNTAMCLFGRLAAANSWCQVTGANCSRIYNNRY